MWPGTMPGKRQVLGYIENLMVFLENGEPLKDLRKRETEYSRVGLGNH